MSNLGCVGHFDTQQSMNFLLGKWLIYRLTDQVSHNQVL